ncbi:MAG: 6,7-dimethyl-8-ribityllumazine synthase [Candidatus Lindowbacteria bacterium]|nr:6,7-dimethyl-8-ribityllumazine synthase [Candidatus Lindowbacteria bacterium]
MASDNTVSHIKLSTELVETSRQVGFGSAPKVQVDCKIGIAVSMTNKFVTEKLLEGAIAELKSHGLNEITVLEVAGSFELLGGTKALLNMGHKGVLALGAVIKGETPHFDYISQGVTNGLAAISAGGNAVGFGVLTSDTVNQAMERAGGAQGNKGAEAALALVQLLSGFSRLKEESDK